MNVHMENVFLEIAKNKKKNWVLQNVLMPLYPVARPFIFINFTFINNIVLFTARTIHIYQKRGNKTYSEITYNHIDN